MEDIAEREKLDVVDPMDVWDNKMADGLMPLEQEVAAFGEKMPEASYKKENRDNTEFVDFDEDCAWSFKARLSRLYPAQYSPTVQNRGLKHHSFEARLYVHR